MAKCPVCNHDVKERSIVCENCCFDDIRNEFINDEELAMWQTYVVRPCKYAYQLNNTLKKEVETLRKELKECSYGCRNTQKTASSSPFQAKANMSEGWNYNDPISHPNSAVGKCWGMTFSVFDIKVQMTSSSTATVTFSVKKESDKSGNNSAAYFLVRYRVKDKTDVICLNEKYRVEGLMPGDVAKGSIKLTGVVAGEYSIDFVSYD